MSKRFIATILAASLGLASLSAQPVQAGNNDLAKFLAGAATLVIIGAAIEQSRRDAAANRAPSKHVYHHAPKPTPKARKREALPEYCLRQVQSHKGPRTIYGKRCLKTNYRAYSALPTQCRVQVQGPHGDRNGFKPKCLYRAGYRG